MTQSKPRTKRSEKGLLTPDNCVLALIDHQPQIFFGVANFDRQSIINNTVALSRAARVFKGVRKAIEDAGKLIKNRSSAPHSRGQ